MDTGLPDPAYRVAVKALCNFTAKGGDLDRRFTPAPTGRQGVEGHGVVASRRGAEYCAEVTLSAEHGTLTVRGRADGYLPAENRLEECKTHRGSVDRIPDNHRMLHWAQLQTYGAMLCARDGLEVVTLALVYFEIDEQQETVLEEPWTAERLNELFRTRCDAFSAWAEREKSHQRQRDRSLGQLAFPFGSLHAQQRMLAEAVYRAACRSGRLLAEAPTGVGKTLGTLFPLLKALGEHRIDRIFYLTAKSTGRALALSAIAQLQRANPGMTLRVLDLVAREKACVQPGKECHGASCPLACGFYDRLPAAREAAAGLEVMDQPSLSSVALAHEVCPYYLGQEMIRWSDVVIADYNHYFDSSAMLHALLRENDWEVGVLVDEAHNLVPRARQMYSARLDESIIRAALVDAPEALQSSVKRVGSHWAALKAGLSSSHAVLTQLPESLVMALRDAARELSDWSVRSTVGLPASLQEFHFAALDCLRLIESFGDHSVIEWTGAEFSVRNIVPAPFLAGRIAAAKAIALFSATLSPREYYQDMLGLREGCASLVVGSPFAAEQLQVSVITDVSTRYHDRGGSMARIVKLIGDQYRRAPGNYLLFAGGFEYLRQIESALRAAHPDIPLWSQTANMAEPARQVFADRFNTGGQGIGLAVLGGAFAEGIDLPGTRLIGAFVLTLGLPAVDASNEETRKRLGYEYTYLYPGLQRVVQAAGRVIRSTADKGCLFLIDERYTLPAIARLLPQWWAVKKVSSGSRKA